MASRGAKGSAAAGGILKPSDLQKLNLDQLKAVKEQSDLEVNLLEDSLKKINVAAARLESAAEVLNDLCLRPQGNFFSFYPMFYVERDHLIVSQGRRCWCPSRHRSMFPGRSMILRRSLSTLAPDILSRLFLFSC